MIQTQPLEVTDFSGGITDYFIDGAPEQAQVLDNMWLDPNRKPFTRWGSQAFVLAQLPLGTFRTNHLLFYRDDAIIFQEKHAYYKTGGNTWGEILGPNGVADPFMPGGNTNSLLCHAEWQDQFLLSSDAKCSIQLLFKDGSTYKVVNAGLPEISGNVTVSNPTGAGESYLYAFCLRYTYTVNGIVYTMRGQPSYVGPVLGGAINGGNTTTATIPAAPIPAVENYDIVNIYVEGYRTLSGGEDYFKYGEVVYGVTSLVDAIDDATLLNGTQLYTNGGLVDGGTMPKHEFVHVVNNTGYTADGVTVRQSLPGAPTSYPLEFESELEQTAKGLSSIFDRPLVFTRDYVYRIDNNFFSDGSGGMDFRRIDDKAGCVSQRSLVQTHLGLFWAGNNGFYWTDGFKVQKISDSLNETYATIVANDTKAKRIYGTYDASTERVLWSVNLDEGDNEPDTVFTLDLKFGIRPSSTFTTMSGGAQFRPTVLGVAKKILYRGDIRGYLLTHEPQLVTDPKINSLQAVNLWGKKAILHTYTSCALDFGTKFMRKIVPRVLISAHNTTNLSLAIASSNDTNRVVGNLLPIDYKSNITWGSVLPVWGDTTAIWNYQGLIEEWRRFPADGLRCNYKQITLTNALVDIVGSSLLGTATVDASLKTATLGGSYNWLPDSDDYFIAFESDGYTREYLILSQTLNTITFDDTANNVSAGVQAWVIRGKPKGEVLKLNGYVLHWALLSKSHAPYSGSGGVGA